MSKTIATLTTVLLVAATAWPGAAQESIATGAPVQMAECADHLRYLEFGTPTDDAVRPACDYRAAAPAGVSSPLASHKLPTVPLPGSGAHALDLSWRLWPSLTDF